ncbi:MAG: hypothetical protein H7Y17_01015 [Chlorobia bacterium]|nr:hypothetical protein [Fimbriimonadaceae bacterium]
MWRAVFLGEAIGPFDQIRQFAPWNGPKPKDAWDVLQADSVLQFYVWRDLAFESWRNFQVPFWNPFQLAGTPLLANSQSGAFYPLHILMGVLHVPTALAITLLAWFHLFWAGLGTAKLVRALGGTEIGGVVAGASFALSPFMLSWTALSSVITTVCWIPWALVGVAYLASGKVEGAHLRYGALIAFAVGMMFLGGHLQFAAYGVGAVCLLTLFNMRSLRAHSLVVVGALVGGFLIAAPQLLPVLKASETSHRRNVPTEAGYESYRGSAIKPFEFANLVTTKALGDPRTPVEINENLTVAEYWPPLAKQGANFAESAVTIGPLVLGLLFLVPWRDRRTWPIAAIGVMALLLAMGTIMNKVLYFGLPGWSSTGSPGRIIVLFVFAACVLAGLGCSRAEYSKKFGSRLVGAILLIPLTLAIASNLVPNWQQGMAELGQSLHAASTPGAVSAILSITVLAGAGWALVTFSKVAKYKWLLPAIPVLIALSGYATNLIPTGKPLTSFGSNAGASPVPVDKGERMAFVNDNWGIIASAQTVVPPNLASLERWHDLAGYDSLLNKDTKAMLDEINGQDSAPPANGNIMFTKPSASPDALREAGVSEVWSLRPLEGFGEPFSSSAAGFFRYRLAGPGRASVDGAAIKDIKESFGSKQVQASGPGTFTLRERNMAGWSATVDGKPATLKGGRWLEVDLPEGKHKVEFNFVSPGYSTGLMLAIPGWLIVIGGLALRLRKKSALNPG